MDKSEMKLESNPHAIHAPKPGWSIDDGLTACDARVSRIVRVTKYPSLVTCMTCARFVTVVDDSFDNGCQ